MDFYPQRKLIEYMLENEIKDFKWTGSTSTSLGDDIRYLLERGKRV